MKVTLRQIEAFYWTAKLGTIHGAAHHLHFSQPAISARIKELEAVLKMELFSRRQQRVELTVAGRNALSHAERVLSASQDFERLGGGAPPLEGLLRLGSDESAAMVGLTEILTQLKLRHPKLIVELSIEVGTVLTEKLRKRQLDIAFHTNFGAGSHVIDELIGWVEFQWLASRDLDIPTGEFLPAHAAELPIVTNSPPSTLNGVVQKWLRSGGFDFDGVNSCNSLSLMLRLVRAGHAIAVLPVAVLREQLLSGELRVLPAKPPLPPTPYYVSYLDEERGPGIAAVIEVARTALERERFFMKVAEPDARAATSANRERGARA
ncbi:LysR family transcriptional regulator [Variovorax sp. LjRoot175]|uniref:LysR family transcriptional regulator n=1 Tax=Variovorax sp. LjRoot175 TaxID=3342276 RepID=UPI003ED0F5CD